jgi:hypothetical protein
MKPEWIETTITHKDGITRVVSTFESNIDPDQLARGTGPDRYPPVGGSPEEILKQLE